MHSFDTLPRTLASQPRVPLRRERRLILGSVVPIACALLPLAVMAHAYLQTA